MNNCTACPPGHYTPTNRSATCLVCPQGKYNEQTGTPTSPRAPINSLLMDSCSTCPDGETTPGVGSYSSSQCLSPLANFVWGFMALGVASLLALVYVVHGRFQQVAFIRRERVVKKQTDAYKRAFLHFEQYFKEIKGQVHHEKARELVESVRDGSNRAGTSLTRFYYLIIELLKTLLFTLVAVVLVLIVAILYILMQFISILFKSLIIWKQMHNLKLFDFKMLDYQSVLNRVIDEIGIVMYRIGFPEVIREAITKLFTPIYFIFDLLAYIRIDFSLINVTCPGAQAPLELLLDCIVLGVVIIIIQSEYQVFSGLIFQSATSRYSEIVLSNEYTAHERKQSQAVYSTFSVITSLIGTLVTQAVGYAGAGVFQSALTFAMSFVKIQTFVENNGAHQFSEACNVVAGAEGLDFTLAILSTTLAYLILPAAFYEVAKVMCPMLDKESQKDARRVLLVGASIRTSKKIAEPRILSLAPRSIPGNVEDAEEGGGKEVAVVARYRRNEPDTDSESSDDDTETKGAICCKIGCRQVAKFNTKGKRRGKFCKLHSDSTLVNVVDDICTYKAGCHELAKFNDPAMLTGKFCALHKQGGMVDVVTRGEGFVRRALERVFWCLRFPSTFLAPDLLLAFVSGRWPETLPVNFKQKFAKKAQEKRRLYTEFRESQQLTRGGGRGQRRTTAFGAQSSSSALSVRKWVTTIFEQVNEEVYIPLARFPSGRTEELQWEDNKLKLALPSYWDLLRHEYREICDFAFTPSPVQALPRLAPVEFFFVLLLGVTQLGHIFTTHGQTACVQIFKRYLSFLQVCFGHWNRKNYESYEVEDTVRKYRLWDDGNVEQNRKNETYGSCLSSLVTTRAILMQVTPYLTLISMAAISISPSPMLVFSDATSRKSSNNTRKRIRAGAQAEEKPWESNLFPMLVLNPLERARGAEEEDKFKRRAWINWLRAGIIFITCSRIFTFAINAYKFGIAIYILYQPSLSRLIFATCIAFSPYALCAGLSVLITVGKKLNIRDPDKLLLPRKEERDLRLIEKEMEKMGSGHIEFRNGFFTFVHGRVLEHIYTTILREKNRTELKKYRLKTTDKLGKNAKAGPGMEGLPDPGRKLHVVEFILGSEEFQAAKAEARKTRVEWVLRDLDEDKRLPLLQRQELAGSTRAAMASAAAGARSWSEGKGKSQLPLGASGLNLTELGGASAAADAEERAVHVMDVQLELETVRRLMEKYRETDDEKGLHPGTTLFSRYLDKIFGDEMLKARDEAHENGDVLREEMLEDRARACCETRVIRKILREGLKCVWFKWLPGWEDSSTGPGQFVYHDVSKKIEDVIEVYDGANLKPDQVINCDIEAESAQYPWLEQVWWEKGKFHWRSKGLHKKSQLEALGGRTTMTLADQLGVQEFYEPQPQLLEATPKNGELQAMVQKFLESKILDVDLSEGDMKKEGKTPVWGLRCQVYSATNESLQMYVLQRRTDKLKENTAQDDDYDVEDEETRKAINLHYQQKQQQQKQLEQKLPQQRANKAWFGSPHGRPDPATTPASSPPTIELTQLPLHSHDKEPGRTITINPADEAPRHRPLDKVPPRLPLDEAPRHRPLDKVPRRLPLDEAPRHRPLDSSPGVSTPWHAHQSRSTGKTYYLNKQTGEKSWKDPHAEGASLHHAEGERRGHKNDTSNAPDAKQQAARDAPKVRLGIKDLTAHRLGLGLGLGLGSIKDLTAHRRLRLDAGGGEAKDAKQVRRDDEADRGEKDKEKDKDAKRRKEKEREKDKGKGSPEINLTEIYPDFDDKGHVGTHAQAASANAAEKAHREDRRRREKEKERDRLKYGEREEDRERERSKVKGRGRGRSEERERASEIDSSPARRSRSGDKKDGRDRDKMRVDVIPSPVLAPQSDTKARSRSRTPATAAPAPTPASARSTSSSRDRERRRLPDPSPSHDEPPDDPPDEPPDQPPTRRPKDKHRVRF